MPLAEFLQVAQQSNVAELELGVGGFTETEGMEASRLLKDSEARQTLVSKIEDHGLGIAAHVRHLPG